LSLTTTLIFTEVGKFNTRNLATVYLHKKYLGCRTEMKKFSSITVIYFLLILKPFNYVQ